MASVTIVNRAGDIVEDGVKPETFMAFKRRCGKAAAIVVELECGEEVVVDTVKMFNKLPHGARYRARLLRRTTAVPQVLEREAAGCNVWMYA